MTDKQTENLIGYDPLAWMNETNAKEETAKEETAAAVDDEWDVDRSSTADDSWDAGIDSTISAINEWDTDSASAVVDEWDVEPSSSIEAMQENQFHAEESYFSAALAIDDAEIKPPLANLSENEIVESMPVPVETNVTVEENVVADEITLMLDEVVNIAHVARLKTRLLDSIAKANSVEIDASNVTIIDTSSLQLFVICKKIAEKEDKQLNFDFASDVVIDAAKLLGVYSILGLDDIASGFF